MSKDPNPKDAAGRAKLPLHLWPASATAYGTVGLVEGMLKYGRANWRATDVYASVYVAAAMRHILAWMEGEDNTDEGGPHLGNALASLAILVDATTQGTLIDDRNLVRRDDAHRAMTEMLTNAIKQLEAAFGQRNPKHYDRRDVMDMKPAPESPKRDTGQPGRPVDIGAAFAAMSRQMNADLQAEKSEGAGVEAAIKSLDDDIRAKLGLRRESAKKDDCNCPACTFRRALEAALGDDIQVEVVRFDPDLGKSGPLKH